MVSLQEGWAVGETAGERDAGRLENPVLPLTDEEDAAAVMLVDPSCRLFVAPQRLA